jgi:hypothetical protein
LWENIQAALDGRFKATGHVNRSKTMASATCVHGMVMISPTYRSIY